MARKQGEDITSIKYGEKRERVNYLDSTLKCN